MNKLHDIKQTILQRATNSEYSVNIARYTKAVDWLFAPENKDIVVKCLHQESQIDYPNYFEMPKNISYKLSSDEVDLLQEFVPNELTTYYRKELETIQKNSIKKPKIK